MTVGKREPMKRSANLSFAAAAVTAASAIFSLSIVDGNVRRWVVVIAVPPILASLYQGVQYRRGESANAFWPIAVYLFFILIYLFSALSLYFFGVILQGTAWVLGRRERSARERQLEPNPETP